MANSKALSLFALIALTLLTIWRIYKRKVSDGFKTAWSAGILAVMIALATDLDPGLGAAVSVAIIIFLLAKTVGGATIQGAISAPSAGGSQASGRSTPVYKA